MEDSIFTTEDCKEVLTRILDTDFKLMNFKFQPISDSITGFLGEHFRVKCEVNVYGKRKTAQFFLKKKISVETQLTHSETISEMADVFSNEFKVLSFLNHGNENASWIPKLLMFKEPNIIILEDLEVRQYQMAKIDFGRFDIAHCKCILTAVAELHTFCFNYARQNKISLLDHLQVFNYNLNNLNDDYGAAMVKSAVEATIFLINETPILQKCPKREIIQNFIEYIGEYIEGMQPKKSKYQTLTHSDLWANNLMFKYDNNTPVDCCLIDFQCIRYLPFTQDVLFSIYVNTSKDFRRKYMEELLEYYYDTFCQILSKKYRLDPDDIITKDEYYKLCEERKRSALMVSIFYKMCLNFDPNFLTEIVKNDSFTELLFGDRTQFIKTQLKVNETYSNLIFNELQDLIDVFI